MIHKLNKNFIERINYDAIGGWKKDNHLEAYQALLKGDSDNLDRDILQTNLEARKFFENRYTPYRITNVDKLENLYTGYFEPTLKASITKDNYFQYPLYSYPESETSKQKILKLTRKEIEESNNLELPVLAWLSDPVDLYFMHIQGSGLLKFNNGTFKRYIFAGKNNHPYASIGKHLIENDLIKKDAISMLSICKWMRKNRQNLSIRLINKSFIFFKEDVYNKDSLSPKGQLDIRLTPRRSIAVDMKLYDLNMPLWLDTIVPNKDNSEKENFRKLMICQDQGSAIKGIFRGDIFFGSGRESGNIAGSMLSKGNIIVFELNEQ